MTNLKKIPKAAIDSTKSRLRKNLMLTPPMVE